MEKLSIKEKIIYRFVLSEKRVYRHWYNRFLLCGMDLDRIRRVISRITNFYGWLDEWSKEGTKLEKLAEEALSEGNVCSARSLFHEASACFHIGQHIYFIDIDQKSKAQERVRVNYKRAIELYDEAERPIRIEIPFQGTVIPGYLHLARKPGRALIIMSCGADGLKEMEGHSGANSLVDAGFNVFPFDGPGQGEMWKNMKMIIDYEKVVSTVIDYFEENNPYDIYPERIGMEGWSFSGYLAPRAAALDKRISCTVGNGGFGFISNKMKLNPIYAREMCHIMGMENPKEILTVMTEQMDLRKVPPLDRPLLIVCGGKDQVIPYPKEQADYVMDWAVGEKELKYYPEGEHCCINYRDEVLSYINDWFRKHLLK
jgi:dienelactone hydrolase